jgi:hypothetical protein
MSNQARTTTDQILDLLLEALLERQQARQQPRQAEIPPASAPPRASALADEPQILDVEPARETSVEAETAEPTSVEETLPEETPAATAEPAAVEETPPGEALEETAAPQPDVAPPAGLPPPHAGAGLAPMLARLFVVLVVLVIIVNIPFNRYGTNLARALPDSAALVIRDGLLLKSSGEEVYVLQDNRLRWITTLDAFTHYGYQWSSVHVVEDAFLERFERGLPIHLLLKCRASPHVYALEDGQKRWIKDIPTFEAQGYLWEEIKFISCEELRRLPDGPPIPEDAGPPPQP